MTNKSYNEKLNDSKDMPKLVDLSDKPDFVARVGGPLNEKFPEGTDGQKALLEMEGHKVLKKGNKYYLKDYGKYLWEIEQLTIIRLWSFPEPFIQCDD